MNVDNQISLIGFESPEEKEHSFIESILPALKTAIEAHGGTGNLLTYKSTKPNEKTGDGYTAVFCGNFTIFRLKMRKGQHYISLPSLFSDLVPDGYPVKQLKSELKYFRLIIDAQHPVEFYTDFLARISGETVNRYPKEWDCCSRYMECSDAKTCVHPDKAFALGCGYRKILNSGRIFYGKNRNID